MQALRFKSMPLHKFSVFIHPTHLIEKEWVDLFEPKEIQAEINNQICVIEIHDVLDLKFSHLHLAEFTIKLALGLDVETFRSMVVKKYGNEIMTKRISIILYKLISV